MNISTEQFKQERLQIILDDRRSGSVELGRLALQTLADYSQVCTIAQTVAYRNELLHFARALQQARPSMAPLYNLVEAWCQWLQAEPESDVAHLRDVALNTALDLLHQSEQAAAAIAEHVSKLIDDDSVVLTHSVSSTVLTCFQALVNKGIRAIITEGAPGGEGRRIAGFLAELAVSADYITDAQLGIFVPKADAILIGADTILADGAIINKAGTYPLALAAREAGVPVYVCAESSKQSPLTVKEAHIEEMDGAELKLPPLPHIKPRNIYFDITPRKLITAWVNEHGVQKMVK